MGKAKCSCGEPLPCPDHTGTDGNEPIAEVALNDIIDVVGEGNRDN